MTPIMNGSIAENFMQAMLVLVEGMAGIFVFMALFYGLVIGLERAFREKKEQ